MAKYKQDVEYPWERQQVLELALVGETSIIAMDDTITDVPGAELRVGLAITYEIVPTVMAELGQLLDELAAIRPELDPPHFHFKDLMNEDASTYRGLSWETRIYFLGKFTKIAVDHQLRIGASLIDPAAAETIRGGLTSRAAEAGLITPNDFPLTRESILAELGLLDTLLHTCPPGRPAAAVMASGPGRPAGRTLIPLLRRTGTTPFNPLEGDPRLSPPGIFVESARFSPFVQLADFAAWGYARIGREADRWLRTQPSDRDVHLVGILAPLRHLLVSPPEGMLVFLELAALDAQWRATRSSQPLL